jgi:hypothetical protein
MAETIITAADWLCEFILYYEAQTRRETPRWTHNSHVMRWRRRLAFELREWLQQRVKILTPCFTATPQPRPDPIGLTGPGTPPAPCHYCPYYYGCENPAKLPEHP